MRVIAGSARRVPLKTPEGMDTRPTQDRIKETLFNMLQYELCLLYTSQASCPVVREKESATCVQMYICKRMCARQK